MQPKRQYRRKYKVFRHARRQQHRSRTAEYFFPKGQLLLLLGSGNHKVFIRAAVIGRRRFSLACAAVYHILRRDRLGKQLSCHARGGSNVEAVGTEK